MQLLVNLGQLKHMPLSRCLLTRRLSVLMCRLHETRVVALNLCMLLGIVQCPQN